MKTDIQKFLNELREDFKANQAGTNSLITEAYCKGDDIWVAELKQSLATRANAMSDVLIALNNVGLITDDEDEEQAELFGID